MRRRELLTSKKAPWNRHFLHHKCQTRSSLTHGIPHSFALHVWMAPAWQEIIWRAAHEVACSHVSGLLMQPKPTAGPDGVARTEASSFERDQRPTEASGFSRLRRI